MKPLPKILLALTAFAALSLAYPASVQAVPTTYVYTGNPFTFATGPYSTSDFVTAMVTLASPLAANMPLTEVTPLAFSVSDGVQTLTTIGFGTGFLFATGPSGNITNWLVEVTDNLEVNGILTRNDAFAARDIGINFADRGENSGHPGHWRSAVPDAGSSLALLSLSLTALGVAARQFTRGAA